MKGVTASLRSCGQISEQNISYALNLKIGFSELSS